MSDDDWPAAGGFNSHHKLPLLECKLKYFPLSSARDDFTWENGSSWSEDDLVIRINLAELLSKISIIPRYQDGINYITGISWEIFWKEHQRKNDKTNVIFMPSFGRNRWWCLSTGDFLKRRALTKHRWLRWSWTTNIPIYPASPPMSDLKCWWVQVMINGSGRPLITIFSSCYRPISESCSLLENLSNLINELWNINGVKIISEGISVDQKVLRESNDVMCGCSWENCKTVRARVYWPGE